MNDEQVNYFLRNWYWEGKEKLIDRYNLINPEESPAFVNELISSQKKFIGITKDFPIEKNNKTIIIGGPCITDCSESITLESINDLLNIITVAKEYDLPAIIYLSTKEEELRSKKDFSSTTKKFIDLIERLSKKENYSKIKIIITSDKKINDLIEKYSKKIDSKITGKELNDLYKIGNTPQTNSEPIDIQKIEIHKRFLVTYLPEFVEEISGIKNPIVFAIENIQQAKAILTARNLTRRQAHGPFHIAFIPTPDTSGKYRMYSSVKESKIYVDKPNNEIINNASDESIDFYYSSFINQENNEKDKRKAVINCISNFQEVIVNG